MYAAVVHYPSAANKQKRLLKAMSMNKKFYF